MDNDNDTDGVGKVVLVVCPAGLTCAYSGEKEQPEEAEDGRGHHLGDGSRVDLLVQFGGQVGIVHVVSVHQVFQQHVHQTCRGTGELLSQEVTQTT